jgi:hypothetical protein
MIVVLKTVMAVDIALPVSIEVTKDGAELLGTEAGDEIGNNPAPDSPGAVQTLVTNLVHDRNLAFPEHQFLFLRWNSVILRQEESQIVITKRPAVIDQNIWLNFKTG